MNLENIFSNLIQDTENVYECFVFNSVQANPDKFQFITLGNTGSHKLQISNITIKSASSVALLSITINSKLNFKEHINNIAKKTYFNLYTLRRLRKFLTLEKAKILACSMHGTMFNDRKSVCLLPINFDVLLKIRYAKNMKLMRYNMKL